MSIAEAQRVAGVPLSALLQRQLAAWREDPRLHSAQLYLFDSGELADCQVNLVGEARPLESWQLGELLQRVSRGESEGFEDARGDERILVYPLLLKGQPRGLWVLFPSDPYAGVAAWAESAVRFCAEMVDPEPEPSSVSDPPTFRQLVEAFPDLEERDETRHAKPHWEQSRASAVVPADQELADGLIVDHLPLF